MFNVGDKVIRLDIDSPYIYTVFKVDGGIYTIGRKVRRRTWGTWLECNEIRLATDKEIKLGKKI